MSSDEMYQDSSPKRDPNKDLKSITNSLKCNFGFTDSKNLGSGCFGVVMKFKKAEKNEKVVIKLRSIVALGRSKVYRPLNIISFEFQGCSSNLMSFVLDSKYLENPESLLELKKWLYQVLCGLDFLHYRQLSHPTLKPEKVLISRRSNRAMLGDFPIPTTSHIRRNQVGLPDFYRPPEISHFFKDTQHIEARYFDLWEFGIISLEILTNFHILRSFSFRRLVIEGHQESLNDVLQEETFTEIMKNALPAVELPSDETQMALNFVQSFLRSDPSARITADVGLQHKFLGQGNFVCSGIDVLWQRPNPTSHHHQSEKPTCRRRLSKWFRRRCSSLRRLITRCVPCVK